MARTLTTLLMLIDDHGRMLDRGTFPDTPEGLAQGLVAARRLALDHPMLEAVLVPSWAVNGRRAGDADAAGEAPVRHLLVTRDPDGELGCCGAYTPAQLDLAQATLNDLARALPTHRAFLVPALAFEAFAPGEVDAARSQLFVMA